MEEVPDEIILDPVLNNKFTNDKGEMATKGSIRDEVAEIFETIFQCVQKMWWNRYGFISEHNSSFKFTRTEIYKE